MTREDLVLKKDILIEKLKEMQLLVETYGQLEIRINEYVGFTKSMEQIMRINEAITWIDNYIFILDLK